MKITVKFFASLRETLGSSLVLELDESAASVALVRQVLASRGAEFEVSLAPGRPVRAALNHQLVPDDVGVKDGDELAFFPPVTGG